MAGDRLVKAVETEEQLAAFMAGFLKTLRGQARHITIPIEDHNKLLEYRDQVRQMGRQGSTRGMAAKLSPLSASPYSEPTEVVDDDHTDNVSPLPKWRSALGFGGKQ